MRTRLQKRFYFVVALLGLTVFTAMATGYEFLYRLAYVLGLTLVLAFVWNWISLVGLKLNVERRTSRINVGEPVEERVRIENVSGLPKPLLEVEDLSDLPGYASAVVVNVPAKKFRSWRTETPARKRGVYTMGPVRVANSDPFGLFYRDRLFGGTALLTIYPRTFDLPSFAVPAADLSGDSSAHRRTHNLTPHAASVRDYAAGDSLSRVHWNTTARMGKLMSKVFDHGRSSDVWIVIDLQADFQAGELEESTDEYAVSIAASVARKYLLAGMPVGLVAYGDQRYFIPAESGMGQIDRIMEYLARSKAEGEMPLGDVLAREDSLWTYYSSLVVITASHLPRWGAALRQLLKRRVRLAAVVLDGSSFGGYFEPTPALEELHEGGVPTYVVRKGDTFSVALGQLYARDGRQPEEKPAAARVSR